MFASRPPCPALRPWVRLLWAGEPGAACAPRREHVLPTGCMHLAVRLGGSPLRVYAGEDDATGHVLGHAVVGGVRGAFHARETGSAGCVGAQLEPGAALVLFGAPAGELAGAHTLLEDLWGRDAALLRERLQEAAGAQSRMDLLESELVVRLAGAQGPHPAVAAALARLRAGASVADAVRAGGLSHRHLLLRFRAWTGLAPAQHARMHRMQDALQALRRHDVPLADVAALAGFADQAHFTRDFRAFAGMTPGEWRRARPAHTHHVGAPQVRSVQDRPRAAR